MTACNTCNGTGDFGRATNGDYLHCPDCGGMGFSDVDPRQPCVHSPGTPQKVAAMASRYAAGMDLWHPRDKLDHDPGVHVQVVEVESWEDEE